MKSGNWSKRSYDVLQTCRNHFAKDITWHHHGSEWVNRTTTGSLQMEILAVLLLHEYLQNHGRKLASQNLGSISVAWTWIEPLYKACTRKYLHTFCVQASFIASSIGVPLYGQTPQTSFPVTNCGFICSQDKIRGQVRVDPQLPTSLPPTPTTPQTEATFRACFFLNLTHTHTHKHTHTHTPMHTHIHTYMHTHIHVHTHTHTHTHTNNFRTLKFRIRSGMLAGFHSAARDQRKSLSVWKPSI